MSNFYQKSCVQIYNNTPAKVLLPMMGGTDVTFGDIETKTGCSIGVDNNGVRICNSGLYEFSFDGSFEVPGKIGDLTAQLYKDGAPVSSAQAVSSIAKTGSESLSFSTRLRVGTCCAIHPKFTVVLSGPDISEITVNHVALGVTRLA